MELLYVLVVAVIFIALTTALAPKVRIAGPIVLVLVGVIVSLLPFVPAIEINPAWILMVVLPPLLYSAAVSVPTMEFRRDFGAISGLSVVLVVISSIALGFLFNWLIPGLGLPLSIALGAILSPTDAVATSIVKQLGLSRRVVTVLEGESMLNDASALVILRTAIVATAAGFSLWSTLASFAWAVISAVVIGAVVGFVTVRVRFWVKHSAANTAIGFAIPFIAYLPTEAVGGSGLVAAVVAGIVTGISAPRWFTPEQRVSDKLTWRTVELVLEGAVFLVMGLELYGILQRSISGHHRLWHTVGIAAAAFVVVLVVRAVYVSPLVMAQSRRARRIDRERLAQQQQELSERARADSWWKRRVHRAQKKRLALAMTDADYFAASPLGWRHGAIIVWAGMRGVVTLAAAQTLPRDTPERDVLVLIAFLVAAGSLLLQGLTLAPVARLLGLGGDDGSGPERTELRALDADLREAAASALADPHLRRADGEPFSHKLLHHDGARFVEPLDAEGEKDALELLELRLVVITAMRARVNALMRTGTYSTETLRRAVTELDAYEIGLELRREDRD